MKKLIPILIALSIFGCKARKVSLVKTDSVVTTASKSAVHTETNSRDTSTTKTETHSKTTDTSSSTVTIVPDSGNVISVTVEPHTSFVFKGKAKSVVYHNKAAVVDTGTSYTFTSGITSVKQVKDSIGQSQTKTEVHKKVKDVVSTPNYSWIWWLLGILAVIVFVLWIWDKFNLIGWIKKII